MIVICFCLKDIYSLITTTESNEIYEQSSTISHQDSKSPAFLLAQARDAESQAQMFELGDRLNAKLQMAKEQMEAKIGNFTCMLRECGVIDASNNLVDVASLQEQTDQFPVQDKWLKEQIREDVATCHAVSSVVGVQSTAENSKVVAS